MIESKIKDLIMHDKVVYKNISNLLHIKQMQVTSEVKFINGIKSDFCFFNEKNEIVAILECKGSDIGVTEYVRGIGQILQYEDFKKRNIGYTFNKKCFILLCITNDLIEKKNLNIYNFAYPKNTNILIINNKNYCTTILKNKDISNKKDFKNFVTISPYYFRDIRIGEMYIVLKKIIKDTALNPNISKIKRKDYENFLKKYNTPNPKCIRNVFISLSVLGLINEFNIPSDEGIRMANFSFEEFCFNVYNNWYSEFINTLLGSFETWRKKNNSYKISNINNKDIADIIRQKYDGVNVKFLTDSKERYISSWLNCMRDDFGCIYFEPHKPKKDIIINYNLTIENKQEVLNNIKKYSNIKYVNLYLNN